MTIAGFFPPYRGRSEPTRLPGGFQTAKIGARSSRRSQVLTVGFMWMHFTRSKGGVLPYTSWQQIAFHIGYLNAVLHYEWLNPIYWSLAVEFQYYLALGLLIPLFSGAKTFPLLSVLFCIAASAFPAESLLFRYLPWFLCGIVAYKHVIKQFTFASFLFYTICLFIYCLGYDGVLCAMVLCSTSLLIAFVRQSGGKVLGFFGTISYSLYLTHAPIGCTIINLSEHFNPTFAQRVVILFLALSATVVASCVMYLLVEKPSLKVAAKIRYLTSTTLLCMRGAEQL